MVPLGLNDVSSELIDDAGDCEDRNFERSRRRYLRGIGFGIEGNEKGSFALVNVCEPGVAG